MAKTTMKMPDDFLLKISKLGSKTDEIVSTVLEAGGEVAEKEVRSQLEGVIGKDLKNESRSTGELLSALGVSKPLQDNNGDFNIKVGFNEPRSNGKSNAMIAGVIEYGKSGQPPKPFMKPAKSKSRKACRQKMIDTLDREIDKI